ncbi:MULTISPECIES: HNH endonuclease [Kordiimonas]|jgi:hypothetical protein|uniref:HNH endonuclease n=1 Tax=Kordiimonas TaxID=288021 RepID=UPI00257F5E28|nr:HNH endonuclease [Kordiimonas sp. UBA4487]
MLDGKSRFEVWLKRKGLSDSSIIKYSNAIAGPLTDWARLEGITNHSILSITDSLYFSEVAKSLRKTAIFRERDTTGHQMYGSALKKYAEYLLACLPPLERDVKEILAVKELSQTEKAQMISARVGQGRFRQELVKIWNRCSVTGYPETGLLIASHIKPWASASATERVDPYNGLLLLPNIDKVFDRGLISFDDYGRIMISEQLPGRKALGIRADMRLSLHNQSRPYMRYHREHVFSA